MSSEGESSSSSSSSSSSKWVEDLQRSVIESKDSAIRSARSLQLQHMNKKNIPSFEDAFVRYQTYEHAFLSKLKEELRIAEEHPAAAIGISLSAAFLLMRGPRRFLFRNTLGRLQSEEARYVRGEKNVKELNLSVDLMKKESTKLLERAALAEKEMKHGETELRNAGSQVQRLAKQAYQVETQAADLMEGLREIPGREALKLRAEVASMASILKRQRVALNKRIMKISELGIPV